MHMLKLVLPLAGLLVVGQALASKASRATHGIPASAGQPSARAGVHPVAPLDRIGGRNAQAPSAVPGGALPPGIVNKHRYTNSH